MTALKQLFSDVKSKNLAVARKAASELVDRYETNKGVQSALHSNAMWIQRIAFLMTNITNNGQVMQKKRKRSPRRK